MAPSVMLLTTVLLTSTLSASDWKSQADARIQDHRRRNAVITVRDANNEPAQLARVAVSQQSHEFWFGTALATRMFRDNTVSREQQDRYLTIVREYFNSAVHENALKWYGTEKKQGQVDFQDADRILQWCEDNSIRMRGHCIFWDVEKYVQDWLKALSPQALLQHVQRRAKQVPARYRGRILEYDVNNEMIHGGYYKNRLGSEEIYHRMFTWAHEADPGAVLYVNDFSILNGGDLEKYKQHIRSFLDAGVPVGGIGCQGHFGRIPPPEEIYERLDSLAEFGLPMKVTEYDCETDDEEYKARALEDFYRICFSHPAVNGILMWGFWEGAHWKPKAAIFNRDFEPTPAAIAYRNLVEKEWRTELTGWTKSDGTFMFKGFFGDYTVTATLPDGTTLEGNLTLSSSDRRPGTLTLKAKKKV
jgi:endo-1,4-beta-xylanase